MKLSERIQERWDSMLDADIPHPVVMKQDLDEWIAKAKQLEQENETLFREHEQNKRMREWFAERTGLDEGLLNIHMKAIDAALDAFPAEPE